MISNGRTFDRITYILYSLFVISSLLFIYQLFDFNLACELRNDTKKNYLKDTFQNNSKVINELEIIQRKRHEYDQAILILIDGMRYDESAFIPVKEYKFQNIFQIFEETEKKFPLNSWHVKSVADIPTYTSPRTMVISVGNFPKFYEFHYNFSSIEIAGDSIFYLLAKKGKKTYHMGDPTLTDLHKSETFSTLDEYSDIRLHDTTKEDEDFVKNLTEFVMKNKSNEIIFFHPLLVDSFGHINGNLKDEFIDILKTVDKLITTIIQNMDNNTILIAFGDHGQTVAGTHGGRTSAEMETTAFIFSSRTPSKYGIFSNAFSKSMIDKLNLSKQYSNDDLSLYSNNSNHGSTFQINLCPTISNILNIPIPRCNEGILIHQFLDYDNVILLSEYTFLISVEYLNNYGQIFSLVKDYKPLAEMLKNLNISNQKIKEELMIQFEEIASQKEQIYQEEKNLLTQIPIQDSFYENLNNIDKIYKFIKNNLDFQIRIKQILNESQNYNRFIVFNNSIINPIFALLLVILILILIFLNFVFSTNDEYLMVFFSYQKGLLFISYGILLSSFVIFHWVISLIIGSLIIFSFLNLIKQTFSIISNFFHNLFLRKRFFPFISLTLSIFWIISCVVDAWSRNEGGMIHYFIAIMIVVLLLNSSKELKFKVIILGLSMIGLFLIQWINNENHYFKKKENFSIISYIIFIIIPIIIIKGILYKRIYDNMNYILELKMLIIPALVNDGLLFLVILSQVENVSNNTMQRIITEVKFGIILFSIVSFISFLFCFHIFHQNADSLNVANISQEQKIKIKILVLFFISFDFFYILEPKSLTILLIFFGLILASIKYLIPMNSKSSIIIKGFILYCFLNYMFYSTDHLKKLNGLQTEYFYTGFQNQHFLI